MKTVIHKKICTDCTLTKSISQFHKHTKKRDGYSNQCKDFKNRERALLRKLHKVAPKRPDACECCGATDKILQLDHDHSNDTFRGWLCGDCNRSIGHLGDNKESVQKALDYLKLVEERNKNYEYLGYRPLDQLE